MSDILVDEFVDQVKREREKLKEKIRNSKFDINNSVADYKFCLTNTINNEKYDIGGLGSIGLVVGHEKSRKTALMSAIVASALGKNKVLGFECDVPGEIYSYDTEQREFSFSKVNRGIYSWAKITVNPANYHAYRLRELFPTERLEFIKEDINKNGDNISMLIIDGVGDLITNFNDIDQSALVVEEVMKLADKNIMVLLVLHYGKGGLMLGHLGSAFRRKLDFLIEVKQDESNKSESIVSCKLTRDTMPFPDFVIKQDNHPPRIYRPQDEMGMWQEENSNIIVPNISITADRVLDDDIPF